MVQKIFGMGFGASGIVGVLILSGIFLSVSNVNALAGQIAACSGVSIGIALGVLGVFGVVVKFLKSTGSLF